VRQCAALANGPLPPAGKPPGGQAMAAMNTGVSAWKFSVD
jgi:hypothetical protein